MNRFFAIVALSLVPFQWAWAQEDSVQSNPQTRDTFWFESNAILESLKTIQLLAVRDQPLLSNELSILTAEIPDSTAKPLKIAAGSILGHLQIEYHLEEISTVLLIISAPDNTVVWKAPVMHRAQGTYQEEIDLGHLRAGNYQISLTTEFDTFDRQLSVRQIEGIATNFRKDMALRDYDNPE